MVFTAQWEWLTDILCLVHLIALVEEVFGRSICYLVGDVLLLIKQDIDVMQVQECLVIIVVFIEMVNGRRK